MPNEDLPKYEDFLAPEDLPNEDLPKYEDVLAPEDCADGLPNDEDQ